MMKFQPKAVRRYQVKRTLIEAFAIFVVIWMAMVAVSAHWPANAQARLIQTEVEKHGGEFVVPLNKSQILRVESAIADLLVGNPEIADVVAITDRSIYVLGKSLGSTSLTIYGPRRELIAVLDLVVALDVASLKQRLHELMPGEKIEVRPANGSLVLSGTVSSASSMSRALDLAERYAPGQVVNMLTVAGSQQVMLAVRFAEVSRNLVKDIGLNTNITGTDAALSTGSFLTGIISPTAFAAATLTATISNFTIDLLLDALENKGVVKTLAEPNLIALSGDTASFLAGGEFPIPVAQESDAGTVTITIEFKEFGVSLAFTPTVLHDGLINLVVSPEVSRIDPTNAVVLNNFRIPGLTTRRATTTVELRDGQSFAIAGLIQNDFQDTVQQFPGIADVPVLGALLRSPSYQRNETELVIIVTPYLVRPAPAGTLVTPADGFKPPSDAEIFLLGRTEALDSGALAQPVSALGARHAGGIAGPHGHIIK